LQKENTLVEIINKALTIVKKSSIENENLLYKVFENFSRGFLILKLENNKIFHEKDSFHEKCRLLNQFFPNMFNTTVSCDKQLVEVARELLLLSNKRNITDPLGHLYQQVLSYSYKQDNGIIFTPLNIVNYILNELKYGKQVYSEKEQTIIDFACGSGIFLSQAARKLIKIGLEKGERILDIKNLIEERIFGFDNDPISVLLTKTNLFLSLTDFLEKRDMEEFSFYPQIYKTNALKAREADQRINAIKKLKFDFVVGNPPYIDSKRMDEHTKKICQDNFPDVAKMHFDIYSCFLKLGVERLKSSGKLGFIIPNKFLISRYAKILRELFLENNFISQVVDLAHQNVFEPAVYPIILILDKQRGRNNKIAMYNNIKIENLNSSSVVLDKQELVETDVFKRTSNKTIFFVDNKTRKLVRTAFNLSKFKIGDFVRFRWAVSFHRKGLREQFIFTEPKGKNPQKILGGRSFGGNREIERYKLNWKGYWIDYDHERAKQLKNNFQDIKYFKKKKIILCQHALRIRATIDQNGFICKDIFLIGHLNEKAKKYDVSLELILAMINSEFYSFLYKTMYSGTEIYAKYLHYLPMFLHDLPFVLPKREEIKELEKLVNKILHSYLSALKILKYNEIYSIKMQKEGKSKKSKDKPLEINPYLKASYQPNFKTKTNLVFSTIWFKFKQFSKRNLTLIWYKIKFRIRVYLFYFEEYVFPFLSPILFIFLFSYFMFIVPIIKTSKFLFNILFPPKIRRKIINFTFEKIVPVITKIALILLSSFFTLISSLGKLVLIIYDIFVPRDLRELVPILQMYRKYLITLANLLSGTKSREIIDS